MTFIDEFADRAKRTNRRVSALVRRSGPDYQLSTRHFRDGLPTHSDTTFVVVLKSGVLGAFNSARQVA